MSLLQDLAAPLDWGRSAVTNFGDGALGLLSGDLSSANLAKMAPGMWGGLAGLIGGAFTGGLGGPAIGSLVGSLVQGGLQNVDPGTYRAKSTNELLRALGGDPDSDLQNLALGAATDPWTYVGAGLLSKGAMRLAKRFAPGAGIGGETNALLAELRAGSRAAPSVAMEMPGMLPEQLLQPHVPPIMARRTYGADRLNVWPFDSLRPWQLPGSPPPGAAM